MALRIRTTGALPLVASLLAGGCFSIEQYAIDKLSGGLAAGAETFAREDDPELVRYSMPLTLKAMEAVLLNDPENTGVLAAAAAGFSQYGYAFVLRDAQAMEETDYAGYLVELDRALRLFLRARDYGLRALEVGHPGIGELLRAAPAEAAAGLGPDDLEAAYWCASAWGLAISAGRDRPELLADIDAVRSLLRRALELDEDFRGGALHEAMIVIEGLPEMMGGSPEKAREHFERALELSGGHTAGTYLSLAENVVLPAQDREEFVRLLEKALAVDLDARPESRLANRLAQDKARALMEKLDDLFL